MTARRFAAVVLFVCLLLALTCSVAAQGPQQLPPSPHEPPRPQPGCGSESAGHWLMSPEGLYYRVTGASEPESTDVHALATGGPDDFGYTWDDSVPLAWIDASGGTDAGINSSTDHVGPIAIGFSFKYYENTYTELYISRYGFVAFNDNGINRSQSQIPNPQLPNDVVAPHWVPAEDVNGYVRYLSGGTEPDRWFVVEWNRLMTHDPCGGSDPNEYTFEIVLHENGDIVFQYGTIAILGGCRYCESSGIEDSRGLDGLSITAFCNSISPDHAVHIYRPAGGARVSVSPKYDGRLVRPGQVVAFQLLVRNIGELGADTYDLTTASTWPVSLFAADGTTPLTDTDSDTIVDTGSIDQGTGATITVKVQALAGGTAGAANAAAVTAASSLDPTKSKTATLQTAIPASFAQVYLDQADGAMSLYLVRPKSQVVKKATDDWYWGGNVATAEAPNGNLAYVWSRSRCLDNACTVWVQEIEYALLNHSGAVVGAVTKVTDHSGATMETADYSPAVAVAPDGRIGLLWYRYLWDGNTGQFNYNIYFAILDSAGALLYGPLNLTDNTAWGTWGDLNVPQLYSPRIAATGDNRFVLAWQQEHQESDGRVDDIWYAVRSSTGEEVRVPTNLTNDLPGWCDGHYDPNLTRLQGNRALLVWMRNGVSDIYYTVLDSAGNTVKSPSNLVGDGSAWWDYNPDAVELPDGNIAVAWTGEQWPNYSIRFAVLDASYNRVAGPTTLDNPAALIGGDYVSIAADAAGHAILTWMDADRSYRVHLYYALVDGSGTVLSQPMIFRTSQSSSPWIVSSYEGYGNTSYTNQPPALGAIVPSSGTAKVGVTKYFTTPWTDPDGYADLQWCYFLVGPGTTPANKVYLGYHQASNKLYIRSNSGLAWWGGYAPGSSNTLQNAKASVDCSLTTVAKAGAKVTIRWAIAFKSTYTGSKNLYLKAKDLAGNVTPWLKRGTVNIVP